MLAGRYDDLRPSFSGLVHSHGAAGGQQCWSLWRVDKRATQPESSTERSKRSAQGKPMAADFAGMPLHVTVSDGEGTGSVAVAWWQQRTRAWKDQNRPGRSPDAVDKTLECFRSQHHPDRGLWAAPGLQDLAKPAEWPLDPLRRQ